MLTLGPAEAEEQIRDSLANGADRGVHLVSDGEEWDPQATAAVIVSTVQAEEAAGGGFDLIVFGNESADSGNYQVGIRVAYALGRPIATGLKGLSVADGRARCEQEVPGGRDVYELPLPAVVSVLEGINLPRYPSVPAKLRARSKPVESSTPERPASQLERLRLVVPPGQGKQAEILGNGPGRGARGRRDDARDRGRRMSRRCVLSSSTRGDRRALAPGRLALARDLGGPASCARHWRRRSELGAYGVETVHVAEDDRLSAYAPARVGRVPRAAHRPHPGHRGGRCRHEPRQRGTRPPRRAPRSSVRRQLHRRRE